MAPTINFDSPLSITHISTAAAILHLDGVNLLTDPVFSPGGTEWDFHGIVTLRKLDSSALGLADLPPIDAVLLSHEDHPDNLDEPGRTLLNGRQVLTTVDGAKNLAPRPGVRGLRPWETVTLSVGGRTLEVTGTPCEHLPGGEVTGFIISTPSGAFGHHPATGKPNAIYFSGDTVHLAELAQMRDRFHIAVALLNIGKAVADLPDDPRGPLQITLDGVQAARLFRDIGADVLVPMHYESWEHFSEKGEELARVFETEGVKDRVCWLTPGVETKLA
ncbi:beta-lactamase superfamily domain-containing protein [Podospora appendiculata]|uniref:Beta-lactamase superfamily domain-containing protein n=1 Tax=Podospora appendiculata TaxID=314037 RepID=A0AAE0XJ29_9PEZI|nr:beta-lactamase superfamily domain-containing protein [Podospora appendiculata]